MTAARRWHLSVWSGACVPASPPSTFDMAVLVVTGLLSQSALVNQVPFTQRRSKWRRFRLRRVGCECPQLASLFATPARSDSFPKSQFLSCVPCVTLAGGLPGILRLRLLHRYRQQQLELDFFLTSLAASQGSTPAERRAWRDGIYEVIQAMTSRSQGGIIKIESMCQLVGIG